LCKEEEGEKETGGTQEEGWPFVSVALAYSSLSIVEAVTLQSDQMAFLDALNMSTVTYVGGWGRPYSNPVLDNGGAGKEAGLLAAVEEETRSSSSSYGTEEVSVRPQSSWE
jgi:hypothetical protein